MEELFLVLDVSFLTGLHFVMFEGFRLIVFVVSIWFSFLFFSIFCAVLHCIEFSVELLDGFFFIYFLVTSIVYHILLLNPVFFPCNSSLSDFSYFQRDCFCVKSCVDIIVKMSWFFVSVYFLRNTVSFQGNLWGF